MTRDELRQLVDSEDISRWMHHCDGGWCEEGQPCEAHAPFVQAIRDLLRAETPLEPVEDEHQRLDGARGDIWQAEAERLRAKLADAAHNCPSCGRHDYGLMAPPIARVRALEAELKTVRQEAIDQCIAAVRARQESEDWVPFCNSGFAFAIDALEALRDQPGARD